jgi:hypothetical protein
MGHEGVMPAILNFWGQALGYGVWLYANFVRNSISGYLLKLALNLRSKFLTNP